MAINKIIYAGNILVDLTEDTITPADLATGVTAHDASGNQITGTSEGIENFEIYGSNPNLLTNWYFIDPVREEEATGQIVGWTPGTPDFFDNSLFYSGVLVDKPWRNTEVCTGIDGAFYQVIGTKRQFQRTHLTFSVLTSERLSSICYDGIEPIVDGHIENFDFLILTNNNDDNIYCVIRGDNFETKLLAMKVEIGDVQTLGRQEGDTWILNDSPPNYVLEKLKAGKYVKSVNRKQGDVELSAEDIDTYNKTELDNLLNQKESVITKNTAFNKNFGTTSGTVCQGNDSRLSNARTPTAHTHDAGEITGGTLAIGRIPTGNTASTVCLGSDSRLSNARTPTAHDHTRLKNPKEKYIYFNSASINVDNGMDNTISLGIANHRWSTVYAATAAINTSDRRQKKDVAPIDGAKALIMGVEPVQYKMIDGTSGRTHYGMIAQQVKEAMTAAGIDDFGGYIRGIDPESGMTQETATEDDVIYGLRYEEFIAPLIAVVQNQQKKIENLEERLGTIEERGMGE